MDPFTIALATFGIQKLRGKSTRTALKDAALMGGGSYAVGALTPNIPQLSALRQPAFSSLGFNTGTTTSGNFLSNVVGKKPMSLEVAKEQGLKGKALEKDVSGSGIMGLGTGEKLAIAGFLTPFLGDDEPGQEPGYSEEDYKQAYKEQSMKLQNKFKPVEAKLPDDVYVRNPSSMFYANEGGLATMLPKYNQGGINYLPSKVSHDENDVNNYVRATGYVEDGSGNGNKDEDTMLAQLADGEFVSRADAVLGAGILSGADPKSFKSMRMAGADFFYDQQKKFKRIYDLVNASKKEN